MLSKNHPIILFIDRNGFSVFQDTQPNILRFNFTPDIVANLDVVNKEQFSNLISTFIRINKIVPSSLALLLSDTVIYVKDLNFPQKSPASNQPQSNPPLLNSANKNIEQEHENEIQNFLENIPFEEVLAKVIKADRLNRIVAVNKDLVMTIADAFVNKESVIEAIIPSFLYGPNISFASGLTQNNIQAILGGSEIMKVGNLLTDQQRVSSLQVEPEKKNPLTSGERKPQSLRQYILIGVFAALLVILVVVYLNLGVSQAPPVGVSSPTIPPAASDAAPAGGPTLSPQEATTAPVNAKSVKIKILQNSGGGEISSDIRNGLKGIGFQDIVDEVSQDSAPEKSSVIFSKNIPSDVKESVIAEIKKILPDVSILENQDPDLTITISIGKLKQIQNAP